jgi:high-affinity Fe2+/Pb2+ permease
VGQLLKGLLGWSPAPSIEMALVYLMFLVPVGAMFLLQTRKVPGVRSAGATQAIVRSN